MNRIAEEDKPCQGEEPSYLEPDLFPYNTPTEFTFRPRKVSKKFRAILLDTYPTINPWTEFGQFALRLLGYLLFPCMMHKETSRIVVSCQVVAALVGVPYNGRFNAGKRLKEFELLVFPLNIHESRYTRGEARTVSVFWPTIIYRAREQELRTLHVSQRPLVYLDTGLAVTERTRRRERQEFQALADARKRFLAPEDHPGYQLVQCLNAQSQRTIRILLHRNSDDLISAAHAMPIRTKREQERKIWSLSRIQDLLECSEMFYKSSAKTVRLSAVDTTIHQLPRELRKIALHGSYSIDLKSAQLALAAKYWDIPALTEALIKADETGASYWVEMLKYLGLSAECKSALKTTTYALVFGRVKGNLVRHLAADLPMAREEGLAVAKRFVAHPLIAAILVARDKKMAEIQEAAGVLDAFGKWIEAHTLVEVRSAMAQQLQSYELKLMQTVLPILETEKRLHVVSWLHDGLTVYCADPMEAKRQVSRLEKKINLAANQLGVVTRVEVELQ